MLITVLTNFKTKLTSRLQLHGPAYIIPHLLPLITTSDGRLTSMVGGGIPGLEMVNNLMMMVILLR